MANQQGIYDGGPSSCTCGERAVTMAACEDQILATDALIDKTITDAVWVYVQGPGIPETQWGTSVEQERYVIEFIGQQCGKRVGKMQKVFSRDDAMDLSFDHCVLVENNIMGYHENHWLLRRKGALGIDFGTPAQGDEWMFVDDSALSLDYSSDQFTVDAVVEAGQRLMGYGNQFGWLWSWS